MDATLLNIVPHMLRSVPVCTCTIPATLRRALRVPRGLASFSTYSARLGPPQHDPKRQWGVVEECEEEVAGSRRHPGMIRMGVLDLPVNINMAVNRVLLKFDANNIRTDAQQFRRQILNRVPAPSQRDIKIRAHKLENEYIREQDLPTRRSKLSEAEKLAIKSRIKDNVLPKLKSEFYQWKPMEYTPYMTALYIATRYSEEFSVMRKILAELKARVPDFAPRSLFDFGSGVGTVAMAAKTVFEDGIEEYFCVDHSPDMNETARAIVDNGGEGREPLLKKAHFRQFLPGKHDRTFDIVTSAYTLMDVGEERDRQEAVRLLWQKTKRFLVLVELGNTLGYRTIIEARDHILKLDRLSKKPIRSPIIEQSVGGGHVFAPCPHSQECPRLAGASDRRDVSCRFPVAFTPLPYMSFRASPKNTGTFSYVVLEKDYREGEEAVPRATDAWPRVVQPVVKRHHHVMCRMCCPDGTLKELITVKRLHEDTFYRFVRNSKWGERVPLAAMEGAQEVDASEVDDAVDEE